MTDNFLLQINDLWVEYETEDARVYAVNGANLKLERRQTLGLVGETGAGKTSTAMSVLRLLPKNLGFIRKGDIIFDGESLLALKEIDMLTYRGSRISMIFQDPMTSLNPVIPVGRQVAEVLELHNSEGLSGEEIDKQVDDMFELVGIPAWRKHEYPHQFSGGMKQRVVIAIALACRPELVIADEPTTALDVTIQAQVLSMMAELKERLGTSMILITHDLGIVAQNCDTVAVMYAGEIIEYGTIQDLFEGERHHPYTEGLFGSIPDIYVESERLHPIDGLMPDPSDLPEGCKFHPRCPYRMPICERVIPCDHDLDGHLIKCHLFNEDNQNDLPAANKRP